MEFVGWHPWKHIADRMIGVPLLAPSYRRNQSWFLIAPAQEPKRLSHIRHIVEFQLIPTVDRRDAELLADTDEIWRNLRKRNTFEPGRLCPFRALTDLVSHSGEVRLDQAEGFDSVLTDGMVHRSIRE